MFCIETDKIKLVLATSLLNVLFEESRSRWLSLNVKIADFDFGREEMEFESELNLSLYLIIFSVNKIGRHV